MSNKNWLIILPLIFFMGCAKEYEKKTFYTNGNIKAIYTYESKEDKETECNYTKYEYTEDGELSRRLHVEKQNIILEIFYFKGQHIIKTIPYVNNKKHGVSRWYTEDGVLAEENLFINDSNLIKVKAFSEENKDLLFYYNVHGNNLEECGLIKFDDNREVVEDKSFYYFIQGNDTILNKDEYEVQISTFTFGYPHTLDSILIGEFNNDFDFIDPQNIIKLKDINANSITYKHKNIVQGQNLLLGKVYISTMDEKSETKLNREFILYKDFYLKKK